MTYQALLLLTLNSVTTLTPSRPPPLPVHILKGHCEGKTWMWVGGTSYLRGKWM